MKLAEANAGIVFPTRVGMNRGRPDFDFAVLRVPHASGDEPLRWSFRQNEGACSPRVWG